MELRNFPSGKTAFYRFDASGDPRALIVLVHGLGEHAGRYAGWAARFNEKGVTLLAFDLPGHGRTPGRWGVMPSPEKVYDTIDEIIREAKGTFQGVPLFLYGHSLGGGIVLNYLIRRKPSVTGAIVTSPWVILSETPPAVKVFLAKVAGTLMPGMTQSSGLKTEYLSRDPEVVNAYRHDPLVHGQISAGLYLWMTGAAEETLARAGEIAIPLLLAHGRNDMITSPSGSVEVAGLAPRATLKLWDEGYHELHNEPLKEEHFEFITEWMDTLL
ncbi:alpha/beta hydrolase [bacterium]|nr:alpha/beta hydrolase [bacterium]